ncbi:MAG: LysR family transcriptional regulator [Tetrasphaera sp.]|nr:LysR family transcriptional regulator [Tetrasphaera sp.]
MRDRVREVDANLLPFLHALLEERNLTHAGVRMAMSQPAMSGALGRLRTHFDDELLIRVGRDFQLTPLAEELRPVVAAAVEAASALLGSGRAFDPATSTKLFTLSMSEYAMTVMAEPVVRAIEVAAPNCTVSVDALPRSAEAVEPALMRRDLLIGPLGFELPGLRQPVFTDHLVCLVAKGNPHVVDGRIDLATLRRMGHVVAEFPAAGTHRRPLEVAVEQVGLADRTVAVSVTSLLTLPFAIKGTDLVAFVPSRLARRCLTPLDLAIVETDVPPVRITEAAHWHPRRDADAAIVWLRKLLYDIAIELEDAGD